MAKPRKNGNDQRAPGIGAPGVANGATAVGGVTSAAPAVESEAILPDPEVRERPRRRQFTAEYKRRVLREADACTEAGARGALLRREGLYSSHLTMWRRQGEAGVLHGLAPRPRGRRAAAVSPLARRVAELERDKARLEQRLQQAETIIEVQKKLSALLGIPLSRPGSDATA